MKYPNAQDILIIHALLIDEIGGLDGVRDVGLLKSISQKPKQKLYGKSVYLSVFEKSAVYLEGLANYHIVSDGNKRTAIAVSSWFLFVNGYEIGVSNKEMVKFVLCVVNKKLDIKTIAKWLETNSKKL
ncbi:type II toxin-antitoxin system death-on-curing family toxin [Patescibacteria group bacterium]